MATKYHSKQRFQPRRPHFSPRQLLTSDQLNLEQAFHLETLRRALHGLTGSGVVYGYSLTIDQSGKLKVENGCIEIGCGLAFDHHGRQLYWPGGWISIDDLAGEKPTSQCEYTLCIHYAEHRAAGSRDSTGCGSCDTNGDDVLWVDHGVVFTLKEGCDEKESECKTWDGCPDINDYVCERLDQEPCYEAPEELRPANCDGEYYDPHHGIPLACVYICDLSRNQEQCGPQYGFCDDEPSVCNYRPFVYRNELLYRLIRGDHLNYAQVKELSWQEWILYEKEWCDQIPWDVFINRVKAGDGFVITFSKPIQTRTLNPGSIILSAAIKEARTDYWESRRIPLSITPGDSGDCTRSVTLIFEDNWCQCEILDQRSTLEYGVIIELTIRGSLVRDKCGCMLDARPLGYEETDHHCCQSRPGGDFIALFRVAPKDQGNVLLESDTPVQAAD